MYLGVVDDLIVSGSMVSSTIWIVVGDSGGIFGRVNLDLTREANAPIPSVLRVCRAITKSRGKRRTAPPNSVKRAL